jgi:hypothetical protein
MFFPVFFMVLESEDVFTIKLVANIKNTAFVKRSVFLNYSEKIEHWAVIVWQPWLNY